MERKAHLLQLCIAGTLLQLGPVHLPATLLTHQPLDLSLKSIFVFLGFLQSGPDTDLLTDQVIVLTLDHIPALQDFMQLLPQSTISLLPSTQLDSHHIAC